MASCRGPPSRGKSCAACTKAKRRCDFAYPACLRCSARGIMCEYPQRTRSSLMRMAQPSSGRGCLPPASPSPPAQAMSPGLFNSTLPLDELLMADTGFSKSFCEKDTIEGAFAGPDSQWHTGQEATSTDPFLPDEGGTNNNYMGRSRGADESAVDSVVKLPTLSFGFSVLPEVLAERLRYGVTYLETIPKTLVETLGTPWCHAELFKMDAPKCLRDVIAYSSLYANKTPETKPFIMKSLVSNLSELSELPIPQTHAEALARTHALGIYHVMALFDGDVESRAAAAALLPQLELAHDALVHHISYDDLSDAVPKDLPLFPLANTEFFWRTWILQESTRRTCLFASQLIRMYSYLTKRKSLVSGGDMQCRSWCLAGRLWRAANAVDFAVAWGEVKRLVATMETLDEVFAEAKAADLDEFGRLLLTCYMGEQEARGWMSVKGGGG